MSKAWVCVIGACVAGVMFLLAALQIEPAELKNPNFDVALGLMVLAFATAIFWAPA